MLGHAPREAESLHLGLRGRAPRDDLEGRGIEIREIGLLDEEAAEDAPDVAHPSRIVGGETGQAQDAALLLGPPELFEGVHGEVGGEEDLQEDARELLDRRQVEPAIDADDAAIDRDGVAGLGAAHGLGHARAQGNAARIGVG